MMRGLTRIFVVSLIAFGAACSNSSNANEPIGVCALLKNYVSYNNKQVTIHANLVASIYGALASDDKDGPSCGVVAIAVTDAAYKGALQARKVHPGQTDVGEYNIVVTGMFKHEKVARSRVRGLFSVTKIVSWVPSGRGPKQPAPLVGKKKGT